jgi:predicted nucleic acid-binding Zn ribbon protein
MYDSDEQSEGPVPQERTCRVCGKTFKGFSEYCSGECFNDDKEARARRNHDAWFRNSTNRFRLDDQEKKFYDSLTADDYKMLKGMLIGV